MLFDHLPMENSWFWCRDISAYQRKTSFLCDRIHWNSRLKTYGKLQTWSQSSSVKGFIIFKPTNLTTNRVFCVPKSCEFTVCFFPAESLVCNKCTFGLLGFCMNAENQTCTNATNVCFTLRTSKSSVHCHEEHNSHLCKRLETQIEVCHFRATFIELLFICRFEGNKKKYYKISCCFLFLPQVSGQVTKIKCG